MKKLLTEEIVAGAIQTLENKNEPVNATKIRVLLGFGAHKTISDMLATLLGTKPPAEDPAAAEAFQSLWQAAVAKGASINAAKIKELETAIAFLDGENERIEAAREEAAGRLEKNQTTVEKLVTDLTLAHEAAAEARRGQEAAQSALTREREQQRQEAEALRRQLQEADTARREAEIKAARAEGELTAILKTKQ